MSISETFCSPVQDINHAFRVSVTEIWIVRWSAMHLRRRCRVPLRPKSVVLPSFHRSDKSFCPERRTSTGMRSLLSHRFGMQRKAHCHWFAYYLSRRNCSIRDCPFQEYERRNPNFDSNFEIILRPKQPSESRVSVDISWIELRFVDDF